MPLEPARSHVTRRQMAVQKNPYEGRWNRWYSAIADILIRAPAASNNDIAKELGKAPNTISMIVNTDMFNEYLAQRKDEWRRTHDFTLLNKLTKVAELSLDSVIEQFEKKKDQVPLALATSTMNSALDRLGYTPKTSPAVEVTVNNDARTQTVVVQGVSATALEEARNALRIAEGKRAEVYDGLIQHQPSLSPPPFGEAQLPARSKAPTNQPEQLDLLELTAVEVGTGSPGSSTNGSPSPQATSPSNNDIGDVHGHPRHPQSGGGADGGDYLSEDLARIFAPTPRRSDQG